MSQVLIIPVWALREHLAEGYKTLEGQTRIIPSGQIREGILER